MIVFDNVISKAACDGFILRTEEIYKNRCDSGMNPMSFSTRLIDIDDPITNKVKGYLEDRVNIKLYHRWTQLQIWPVDSISPRHIHDDPRAGDANYTSMLYLNDDFDGGIFHTDDIQIKPVPGRLTLFNGREVYHGVSTILNKPRYCIIFWWNVEESFV